MGGFEDVVEPTGPEQVFVDELLDGRTNLCGVLHHEQEGHLRYVQVVEHPAENDLVAEGLDRHLSFTGDLHGVHQRGEVTPRHIVDAHDVEVGVHPELLRSFNPRSHGLLVQGIAHGRLGTPLWYGHHGAEDLPRHQPPGHVRLAQLAVHSLHAHALGHLAVHGGHHDIQGLHHCVTINEDAESVSRLQRNVGLRNHRDAQPSGVVGKPDGVTCLHTHGNVDNNASGHVHPVGQVANGRWSNNEEIRHTFCHRQRSLQRT
mmetsp:Transcript_65161/g.172639  ORF Transcript_65161/g.172639 Transcript_65161/m.172639 type:complete len:260 (-) Transcript_65161:18-797(-)